MNHIIYLIRHARTEGNILGKYIGVTDQPLCQEGIKELEAYIQAGKYPAVDYVFVSPMQRCLQTRERITAGCPMKSSRNWLSATLAFLKIKPMNNS